jgi:hypothetical protein
VLCGGPVIGIGYLKDLVGWNAVESVRGSPHGHFELFAHHSLQTSPINRTGTESSDTAMPTIPKPGSVPCITR